MLSKAPLFKENQLEKNFLKNEFYLFNLNIDIYKSGIFVFSKFFYKYLAFEPLTPLSSPCRNKTY